MSKYKVKMIFGGRKKVAFNTSQGLALERKLFDIAVAASNENLPLSEELCLLSLSRPQKKIYTRF